MATPPWPSSASSRSGSYSPATLCSSLPLSSTQRLAATCSPASPHYASSAARVGAEGGSRRSRHPGEEMARPEILFPALNFAEWIEPIGARTQPNVPWLCPDT